MKGKRKKRALRAAGALLLGALLLGAAPLGGEKKGAGTARAADPVGDMEIPITLFATKEDLFSKFNGDNLQHKEVFFGHDKNDPKGAQENQPWIIAGKDTNQGTALVLQAADPLGPNRNFHYTYQSNQNVGQDWEVSGLNWGQSVWPNNYAGADIRRGEHDNVDPKKRDGLWQRAENPDYFTEKERGMMQFSTVKVDNYQNNVPYSCNKEKLYLPYGVYGAKDYIYVGDGSTTDGLKVKVNLLHAGYGWTWLRAPRTYSYHLLRACCSA